MFGLLRVTFNVLEVQAVTPAEHDIPLAGLDEDGHYSKLPDQRYILLSFEGDKKLHSFALTTGEAERLQKGLELAQAKLVACSPC
jgi:hypothetical protein